MFSAGSGPCDRDSTIGSTKPLKDLAPGLSKHGIASIRIDKVTHTHKKALRNRKIFMLTEYYIPHALDAITQAQNHANIQASQIFLLGHSLGAVVAPEIASSNISPPIAGCIIVAGPSESSYRSHIRQARYIESLEMDLNHYIRQKRSKKCVSRQ